MQTNTNEDYAELCKDRERLRVLIAGTCFENSAEAEACQAAGKELGPPPESMKPKHVIAMLDLALAKLPAIIERRRAV